jgi:hypothetical protein
MEVDDSDAVAAMATAGGMNAFVAVGTFDTHQDGITRTWVGRAPYGGTRTTAAAMAIALPDLLLSLRDPLCEELPDGIFKAISADPTCSLAEEYRLYIERTLFPSAQKVVELLYAHNAVLQMPPQDYLHKTYPSMGFDVKHGDWFLQNWVTYVREGERVLTHWAAGQFATLRPYFMMPYGGLKNTIRWSISAGEMKQRELIGMTKADHSISAAMAELADQMANQEET